MSDRDGTDETPDNSSATEPGPDPGGSTGDDPADWIGDDPFQDPFSEGDRADLEARVVDPDDEAGGLEAVVPKSTYCQRCEHFATPPTVACDNPGTALLEVVDVHRFRVRDCPVVEQRLGEVDLWDATVAETEGDGASSPAAGGTSGSNSEPAVDSDSEASTSNRDAD